ncbi:MAG: tRNA pseudouridine(55) synthase TruB [Candidatus Electrothrix sp. GW3-4]|uniref:tRNA pseudouridine(55) synthase TruB n=1 Tax=Candidatus Electrothrix sp. GW3-4 TaxID=3126740 RepID=UPI0030D42338
MTEKIPVVTQNGQETGAGVLLIDKPVGQSSFAVVKKVRWLLGVKKVGHAGTLDPFASGLLVICVGRPATRQISAFMNGRKTYHAVLQLGRETETQDPEGKVISVRPVPSLSLGEIRTVTDAFVGPQMQAPPPYSAAKHKGKPLYHYARQGILIEKDAKSIEIFSLQVEEYDPVCEQVQIMVTCSKGTYIRVLAADIGKKLGCGAYLTALRRTQSGGFAVGDAVVNGEDLFSHDYKNDNKDAGAELLLSKMFSVEQALACHSPQENG